MNEKLFGLPPPYSTVFINHSDLCYFFFLYKQMRFKLAIWLSFLNIEPDA